MKEITKLTCWLESLLLGSFRSADLLGEKHKEANKTGGQGAAGEFR